MTVQETIHEMAVRARAASAGLAKMTTEEKNAALLAVADALEGARGAICEANAADVARAKEAGIAPGKLELTPDPAFSLRPAQKTQGLLPEGFVPRKTVGLNVSPMVQDSEQAPYMYC